jgi:hypothetical protein
MITQEKEARGKLKAATLKPLPGAGESGGVSAADDDEDFFFGFGIPESTGAPVKQATGTRVVVVSRECELNPMGLGYVRVAVRVAVPSSDPVLLVSTQAPVPAQALVPLKSTMPTCTLQASLPFFR